MKTLVAFMALAVLVGAAPQSLRADSPESAETAALALPGAPDGDYVVIRFTSSFEHKAEATETVTPMKDPDGHWRVSGYYIR